MKAGTDKHSQLAGGAFRLLEKLGKTRWRRPVFLAGLAVVAFHDLLSLRHYRFPVGVDGYYYLLQVAELQNKGHLYFHSITPLAFYFLAGISYLTGNSVLGIKLGVIILHALLCAGIFATLVSATRSEWIGVLGGALAAVSGLRFYMLSEFIASLMAITLLVWCAFCVIKLFQTRRIAWAVYAIILLLSAAFSHRLALVIVFGIVLFAVVLHWLLVTESPRGYRPYAALLFFSILWLSPAILAMQPLVGLPRWLTDEVLTVPKPPFDQFALGEEIVLLVVSLLILFLLIGFKKRLPANASSYLFGSIALWSLVVTLNPFLNPMTGWLSLAGRLRGLAYIQVAILAPVLLWWVLHVRRELAPYVAAIIVPFVLLSAFSRLPRGMQPEYLSEREQLLAGLPVHRQQLGPNPLVIAAHGEEFLVTSVLGVPSQHTPPVKTNYQDIYWLLHGLNNEDSFPPALVVKAESPNTSTVLVEDGELRRRLAGMENWERIRLIAVNPHLARANYLGSPSRR